MQTGGAMTKKQLVDRLAAKNPHLTRSDAERVVSCLLARIETGLVQRQRVEMRGFGNFEVRVRPARQARNLRTGEMVHVPSRAALRFRSGKTLYELLNPGPVPESDAGSDCRRPNGASLATPRHVSRGRR